MRLHVLVRGAQYIDEISLSQYHVAQFHIENVLESMQYSVYFVDRCIRWLCGLAEFDLEAS